MSRKVTALAITHNVLPDNRPWRTWEKHRRTASRRLANETSHKNDTEDVDFSIFTPEKYLLSHATIVGGVEPEDNGYYIRPAHNKWVNDNGNAWLNQVLLESYKSFIMAENYLEHIQFPALSKGKILDSVAWVVREHEPGRKELLPTVFVDILVATHRKHHDLISLIQSKKLNGLSMGCNILFSQCSFCGEIFEEGVDEPCEHVRSELRHYFARGGKKYRKAELCGLPGRRGSCIFTEASWVGVPAFTPAIRHGSLRVGEKWNGTPLRAKVPTSRIMEAAKESDR